VALLYVLQYTIFLLYFLNEQWLRTDDPLQSA